MYHVHWISDPGKIGERLRQPLLHFRLPGQQDGAAIITRLMDTIQKTAAQIIETIETHLIGEHTESAEIEEALSSDRALVGV